jgi:hypothetical protein
VQLPRGFFFPILSLPLAPVGALERFQLFHHPRPHPRNRAGLNNNL